MSRIAASPSAGKLDRMLICVLALLFALSPAEQEVAKVLDGWHAAAAAAQEDAYFNAMTPDAVFLGTDATERWDRAAFRTFAHPYFAKGKAWNFRSVRRAVSFAPDGKLAWFDEDLATPNLGPSRGSGVLVKTAQGWKIAQYNLTVPIPNALLKEFKARIEATSRK